MAPELHKKQIEYDEKVDIWAAGVIAFRLLAGGKPFKGKFLDQIKYEISRNKPDYSLLSNCSQHA